MLCYNICSSVLYYETINNAHVKVSARSLFLNLSRDLYIRSEIPTITIHQGLGVGDGMNYSIIIYA